MSGLALAGWLLLALLAGLLALLAIPVDLEFSLQRRGGRQTGGGTLRWLFGAVRVPLHPRAKRRPPKHKGRERGRSGARRVLSLLQTEGFGGRLLKLAQDLLRCIRVRNLSLDVRLGLDDPADTGRLWAVAGPLAAMLPLPPATRLTVVPDFATEVFEAEGQGRIRIVPIRCLAAILVFVLSSAAPHARRAPRPQAR